MTEDAIVSIEIDGAGQLCVRPAQGEFDRIYRAGMQVGWDPVRRCLSAPRPEEWTYPRWFREIVSAVASEYRIQLVVTADTTWANVADVMRSDMTAYQHGVRRTIRYEWLDDDAAARARALQLTDHSACVLIWNEVRRIGLVASLGSGAQSLPAA